MAGSCCASVVLQDLDVYKLPEQIGRQVTEQYERDVARVHGGEVEDSQAEYRKFMSGLGGAPPPELMGLDAHGTCATSAFDVSGVLVCCLLRRACAAAAG
jgi:hypothetical protein